MVIPRAFSSGALSIWSNARAAPPKCFANTVVIAAVKVVLPCQRDRLYLRLRGVYCVQIFP